MERKEKFPKKFRTLEVLIGPVSWWGLATVAFVGVEIIMLQQRREEVKLTSKYCWYK